MVTVKLSRPSDLAMHQSNQHKLDIENENPFSKTQNQSHILKYDEFRPAWRTLNDKINESPFPNALSCTSHCLKSSFSMNWHLWEESRIPRTCHRRLDSGITDQIVITQHPDQFEVSPIWTSNYCLHVWLPSDYELLPGMMMCGCIWINLVDGSVSLEQLQSWCWTPHW